MVSELLFLDVGSFSKCQMIGRRRLAVEVGHVTSSRVEKVLSKGAAAAVEGE